MLFQIQVPRQDSAVFTPSGFLIADCYATGIGVYVYNLESGQTVYEYRSLDEVGKPESLASILGSPLSVYHPPTFFNPDNWQAKFVGAFLQAGVIEQSRVKSKIIIYPRKTIEDVLSGRLTEISMGYWMIPISETGQYEGQSYSIRQTNMFYNHGSLYEPGGGRLGAGVGVTLDGKQWRQTLPSNSNQNNDSQERKFMLINIGGKQFDIPDAIAAQVADAANSVQTALDTASGELKTLKATNQSQDAAAQAAAAQKAIEDAANQRVQLIQNAAKFLPDTFVFDGKSNRQIMVAALDSIGVKVQDSDSDVSVASSFSTAAQLKGGNQGRADGVDPVKGLLGRIGQGRTDGASGTTTGRRDGAYTPISKRTDGQIGDAMQELDAMNRHYNNPRNYPVAGGRK